MMMKTVINLLSVIPMRKEPAHRSELVSQLLFGEYAEVLETEKDFLRIKCLYDNYEGWAQANQLNEVENTFTTNLYVGNWSEEVSVGGQIIHASMCSPVYSTKGNSVQLGNKQIRYLHNEFWNNSKKIMTQESLESVYIKFLNTPYLWGGRSVFGIDCSGFVQQVFKMFGLKLLRDAYLQAEQGVLVQRLDETKLGDLAFFHNETGRVVHVGIILGNGQIVHSSGKVRIDTIDKNGIVNQDTGKRTHQLHSIRRIS